MRANKYNLLGAIAIIALLCAMWLPVGEETGMTTNMERTTIRSQPIDLSVYADTPPEQPLQLLFIHHSCGGQLLAAPGSENGANAIYSTHPNGGGLRSILEDNLYKVHEASYGSTLGENTDIFDWLPKFRNEMESVLTCASQDSQHTDDRRNRIVVFKSCYPNSAFRAEGRSPGNPAGPELTIWNAKAAYAALLGEFRKYPDVLFVCVTAPPLAPQMRPMPLWKHMVGIVRGTHFDLATSGHLARGFNNWLVDTNGWLNSYPLRNVVVFDYFDILTGNGASNLSQYPTGSGYDSHPSSEGNRKAAIAFVPFLNRAARRANVIMATMR